MGQKLCKFNLWGRPEGRPACISPLTGRKSYKSTATQIPTGAEAYQSPDGAKVLQGEIYMFDNLTNNTYQSPDGAKVLQVYDRIK